MGLAEVGVLLRLVLLNLGWSFGGLVLGVLRGMALGRLGVDVFGGFKGKRKFV